MEKYRSLAFPALVLVCIIALSGCATAPKQDTQLYAYPMPPDEPRIVYLRSHYGASDFEELNIFDLFLGKSSNIAPIAKPYGVFVQNDKIYVTASMGREIQVIDPKLKKVHYIGRSGSARLAEPLGVAVTRDETVYVSDGKENKIFVFDGKGRFKTAMGKPGDFVNPAGIAINEDLGRLYIADSQAHEVRVFSLQGQDLFRFGKRGLENGQFNFPTNLAVDRKTGNVLVVDTQNFRVQVFDKDGKFISKFGEVGDRPGFFSRPRGIALDSEGHIYVSDAAFSNFQIFDDKFQILLYVGEAGRGPGGFQTIAGMYIDDQDRIYAVDQLNNRVQVFQYLSQKWKQAHPDEYAKYLSPQNDNKE